MRADSSMVGAPKYERVQNDFYPTETPATEALYRYLRSNSLIDDETKVLEPACGDGAIVRVFERHGHTVEASDLFPQMDGATVEDYLTGEICMPRDSIMVTNPPYAQPWIDLFIQRTIDIVKDPATGITIGALLMRNEVDAAVSRMRFFEQCPNFHAKLVLTWRPRWIPGSTGSPRHNYAWYIWTSRMRNSAADISYARKTA